LKKYFRSWFDTSPRTENQLFTTNTSIRPIEACPELVEGGEKGVLQEAQRKEPQAGKCSSVTHDLEDRSW
jgi:hypothetical protein